MIFLISSALFLISANRTQDRRGERPWIRRRKTPKSSNKGKVISATRRDEIRVSGFTFGASAQSSINIARFIFSNNHSFVIDAINRNASEASSLMVVDLDTSDAQLVAPPVIESPPDERTVKLESSELPASFNSVVPTSDQQVDAKQYWRNNLPESWW